MKEFPGQLDLRFDARNNPPSREQESAYTAMGLHSIVDELDSIIGQSAKFFSTGSVTGDDADVLKFWEEGYVARHEQSRIKHTMRFCADISLP